MSTIRPGDVAPDVRLPAVTREGSVSLADYRGRSPLLLALFRGLY
jgi:peroxiredoxin